MAGFVGSLKGQSLEKLSLIRLNSIENLHLVRKIYISITIIPVLSIDTDTNK